MRVLFAACTIAATTLIVVLASADGLYPNTAADPSLPLTGGTLTGALTAPAVTAATFTATAGGSIYSDAFASTSGAGISVTDDLELLATGALVIGDRLSISSPSTGQILMSLPDTELGLLLGASVEGVVSYRTYDGSALYPIEAASLEADTVTATTSVTTGTMTADSIETGDFTVLAGGSIYSDSFGSTSEDVITCTDPVTLPSILLMQHPDPQPPFITKTGPLRLQQSLYGYLEILDGVGIPGISLREIHAVNKVMLGDDLVTFTSPTGAGVVLTDESQTAPVPLVIGPADDADSVSLTASAGGVITFGRPGSEALADISARHLGLSGTLTASSVTGAVVIAPIIQGGTLRAATDKGAYTLVLVGSPVTATFPADPGAATAVATGVRLAKQRILGISARVITAGGGCVAVNVGDGTDEDRYGAAIAVTEGATIGQDTATADPGEWLTAPGDVVVTGLDALGDPANCIDLEIAVTAHYLSYTPQSVP